MAIVIFIVQKIVVDYHCSLLTIDPKDNAINSTLVNTVVQKCGSYTLRDFRIARCGRTKIAIPTVALLYIFLVGVIFEQTWVL